MSDNDNGMEKHVYDGIEEHDNQLPRWWVGLLYATIVFGAGYFAHYVMGPGPTLVQEYDAEMQEAEFRKLAEQGAPKAAGEAELAALLKSPERRSAGQAVFAGKCAACHGAAGQGGIGPNLTDDHWLHGGKLTQIAKTVTDGVGDKGMPPWGPILSPDEIASVTVFIRTLRGSNPAGAKAPQGEKVAIE